MRTKLCAELGTAAHGNLGVAIQMIQAVAPFVDAVKVQHYGAVNPADPQKDWLEASRWSQLELLNLRDQAHGRGLELWATPFDTGALNQLLDIGVDRIKIASTQADEDWWWRKPVIPGTFERAIPSVVSWPWGQGGQQSSRLPSTIWLTAIPLYPTPLEAVSQAKTLDGWSDHIVGLSACYKAIVEGAQWIEAHLKLPGVTTRDRDWEKTPEDFRQLRQFAEDVETMRTGVSQVFRDRWVR